MRWKAAQIGDRRTVRKFAWLPVTVDKVTVWLERYEADQSYRWGDGSDEPLGWYDNVRRTLK